MYSTCTVLPRVHKAGSVYSVLVHSYSLSITAGPKNGETDVWIGVGLELVRIGMLVFGCDGREDRGDRQWVM